MLKDIASSFNGREQALVVWTLIILGYCLINARLRPLVRDILKSIFATKLLFAFASMGGYIVMLTFILKNLGLWDFSLLKDSLFWFFGSGIVLFMSASKASSDSSLIKKLFLSSFTLIIILEFIANLYSFNVFLEFMLVPILVIIVGMNTLADMKEEYKTIRKPLSMILSAYGFFILFYSVRAAIIDLESFLTLHNLMSFIIPLGLTLAFLPFVYMLALVMAYEMLFIRIGLFVKNNPRLLNSAKWKVFLLCKFNLSKLNHFANNYVKQFTMIKTENDLVSLIDKTKSA